MSNTSVVDTLQVAAMDFNDIAVKDVLGLTMAVAWATDAQSALERLTEFVAERLGASQCSVYQLYLEKEERDLITAADARRPDLVGSRIPDLKWSTAVRAVVERGRQWVRLRSSKDEFGQADLNATDERPPPIVHGSLTETTSGRHRITGLIVPLLDRRRVVGLLWVGPAIERSTYDKWALAVAQAAGALAGQALGGLFRSELGEEQAIVASLERKNHQLRIEIEDRSDDLRTLAHDLQAPLGVLRKHVERLHSTATISDKRTDAISRQCDRLQVRLDQLRASAEGEPESLVFTISVLSDTLERWTEDFEALAQDGDVEFNHVLPRETSERRFDHGRTYEVLSALLSGTIQHCEAGSAVRLEARILNVDDLVVRISDTGPAFSEDGLKAGRDFGHRVGTRLSPNCRVLYRRVFALCKLLGGTLRARNGAGGPELTVLLPIPRADLRNLPTQTKEERSRILLIDPDRQGLNRVSAALLGEFEVVTARTEREGLWLVRQYHVDCAIIDLNPPLLSGFATAVALRRTTNRQHLPVIFVAEPDVEGVSLRHRAQEVEEILFKPIVTDKLASSVRDAIELASERMTMAGGGKRDELTGLMNRAYAESVMARQLAAAHSSDAPITVLLIDVDEMGQVNELCSRAVGDALLRTMGETLRRVTRNQEFAARWGGDEFLCILPATSLISGRLVADRLRERLSRCRADSAASTVSVGVVTATANVQVSPQEMLIRAQSALDAAKANGGDNISVWREVTAEFK